MQALIKGEIDFVEDISALQVEALQGEDGITAHNGDSPGFDEIAFNTGVGRHRDRRADRRPQPGACWTRSSGTRSATPSTATQIIETAYQGAGDAGHHDHPAGLPRLPLGAAGRRGVHLRPRQGRPAARRGRLHDGLRRQAHDARRHADRHPAARSRAATRRPRSDTMDFFQEWLGDLGIDSEVSTVESSKLTDVILDGNFDAFEWGWYVEPDPDSMLGYMTCGQRGNWSDSWYCNEEYDALYDAAARRDGRRGARPRSVKQMQEILYRGLALPRHGVHLDRRGRAAATGSPASSRSPTRAASGSSSTASTTTSTCGRPPTPATATASRRRRRRGAAERAPAEQRRRREHRRPDRRSASLLVVAGGRRRRRADAAPGDRGRPRVTLLGEPSDRSAEPPADRAGRGGGTATAATSSARCSGRSAAWCSCWW